MIVNLLADHREKINWMVIEDTQNHLEKQEKIKMTMIKLKIKIETIKMLEINLRLMIKETEMIIKDTYHREN